MNRFFTFFTFYVLVSSVVFAQTDSAITTSPDTSKTNIQKTRSSNEDFQTKGISVSPSHFHLTQKPGEVKTYKISVKNDTESAKQFKVNIYDFDMNGKGKSSFIQPGQGKFSLSRWLNISPTFIEVKPGEKKEVKFTVSVPNDEKGNKSAWSIIMIEQEEPRKTLEPASKSENTVALGVIPTFAFGVFIYQNPPNVVTNNVEITNFQFLEKDTTKSIVIEAANKGDGIAYCTSYIDLTNLSNGKQQRVTVKKFTILPELVRDFTFILPNYLEKGKYLAIGVLDYENSEEIQAAKLNFEIK
ncbi:MAG: DUF916 domain-containing protein [Flavobacteriales bacterium]|nr:hypothetical protein [Flavobacteriales bacterium]MBX2959834.1 DUF916 domain-containing protein [Flavobacteriales bacterium]HRP58713.1 DUF916 domain-containing protein [Vicingus sp.]